MEPLMTTDIPGYPVYRGKVRDVYDIGVGPAIGLHGEPRTDGIQKLVIIATDRISAFDRILPNGIPGKGKILTQMTAFWVKELNLGLESHLLSTHLSVLPEVFRRPELEGRTMLVFKTAPVKYECVVRGYLAGSAWKEYQESGTVHKIPMPAGLKQNDKLPEPLFTPSTKEEHGHDINISFEEMQLPRVTAEELRDRSLNIYQRAAEKALKRGIIIADTKFEWGVISTGGRFKLILIDEILTPDSSRFWPAGGASYDKQYVRDWLANSGWDKESTPPELPPEVVQQTAEKYQEVMTKLSEQ